MIDANTRLVAAALGAAVPAGPAEPLRGLGDVAAALGAEGTGQPSALLRSLENVEAHDAPRLAQQLNLPTHSNIT